jgi:Ca-activated chloride channel homolog
MPWYSFYWFSPAHWQQIQFANPVVLYAIPVALLLFRFRKRLHRAAEQQLQISRLSARRFGWWWRYLRLLMPMMAFLSLAFLLVALARPQRVSERRETEWPGIDIMLAVDVSSSMAEKDIIPNRLSAAQRVARQFVTTRKHDRIGLVIFAGEAFSLCPLTTDHPLVQQYLAELKLGMIQTTGTAIGDALARCINRLRNPDNDTQQPGPKQTKVVILLSDGDNTAGNLDPVTTARLAKAFGIRLYTIAVGRTLTPAQFPADSLTTLTNASQSVDEGVLKTIATIGNGRFFRATDAAKLSAIFSDIDQLEKVPMRSRVVRNAQDFYRIYLYWGLVCMLIALALKSTIFSNVLED